MAGSSVVTIQSAVVGARALRYAHLISIVAIVLLWMMASCSMKAKVRGFMVGL